MQRVNLYRYEDENGVVTITPNPRTETDIPSRLRLVADEGMILTDGNTKTPVVDILPEEEGNWHEITDEEAEKMQKVESEVDENG
jgi:hypothetical protein